MPMASASNSCAREKLASASFDLASASAPTSGSLMHVGDDASDQGGLARLLFADRGMARDHVTHFVRQHRGELGFVVGERDQPAGDVKLAARQGERVDRLRVEDDDLVVQIGMFRRADEPVDGLLQQALELGIIVDAAIGAENALMLVQHRGRHVGHVGGFRCARQRGLRAERRRRRRAGGNDEREHGKHRGRKARACRLYEALHRHFTSSVRCVDLVAACRTLVRLLIHPR